MRPQNLTPCHFRIATPADLNICVHLLSQLLDEVGPSDGDPELKERLLPDLRAALSKSSVHIILADVDGASVALARGDILFESPIFRLRQQSQCGYIDQLFVTRPHRALGIGTRLLKLLEAWFVTQKITHVLLHAAPKANAFYARLGFASNREMFKRLG